MLSNYYRYYRMSYCINPNCSNRENPDDCEFCQTCGTKLLINEQYQIVKPLRVGQVYNSEVFEVKDFNEPGISKILKSLSTKSNNSKIIELFEKEAQVLIWLSSDWHQHPGIPKVKPDGYFSFAISNNLRKLQCLVMEKIEGQNLEQWLNKHDCISQDQAENWLQQLVEILDKVHQQGLWHRDIKPSNIMLKPDGQLVLIDFGAVGIGTTRIVSAEYTPLEQIEGKTVLQSDFFAVGRTLVYLLTGKHPHELSKTSKTKKIIWRNVTPKISEQLANLIDDLMAPLPENRPQNTQEILQRLQLVNNSSFLTTLNPDTDTLINSISSVQPQTSTPGKMNFLRNKLKVLGISSAIITLGIAVTVTYRAVPCQMLGSLKICLPTHTDNLSLGEKILVPNSATPEKVAGTKAILAGNYTDAIKWLEQARENQRNDPETLIYLNNARIEAQQSKVYTIAVVAPLSDNHDILNSGLEILRGVAQAQNEVNQSQKNNKIKLKVLIANDQNDAEKAKKIAEELGNKENVLGVVGHVTSDVTLAVVDSYQQNQLVLISPTSTSDELSTKSNTQVNFFFRTVSSDRVTAQALTSYLLNYAHQQKATVFYNPHSVYSSSLRNQFSIDFSASGGKIVEEFDLSTFLFSAAKTINKAQKQGSSALILLPDSTTRTRALEVIKANSSRYLIVGGDNVYSPNLFKMGDQDALGLVLAIPWQNSRSPNSEFPQVAQKLWGGSVSWRTALAYDATRALIEALEDTSNPSRTLLQQTLSNPNFQATGATGAINFRANGDRKQPQIQLVQVGLNKQKQLVYNPLKIKP